MKFLIVNADDFGYSYSVNRGIIEAHLKGIVTSTSVMVDSVAAEEARQLDAYANLSVGLHFVVVAMQNIEEQLSNQIERFTSIVGTGPDHIDTHKRHTTDPGLKQVLVEYGKKHHIPVRDFGQAKFIDDFFGFHSDGDVSVGRLKLAIDQATDEYNEIMCHVGYSDDYLRAHSSYNDPREEELRSVCSPEIKEYLAARGLQLCNWKQVQI